VSTTPRWTTSFSHASELPTQSPTFYEMSFVSTPYLDKVSYELSCEARSSLQCISSRNRRMLPLAQIRRSVAKGLWNNVRPLNCRYKTSPSCVSVREERPCMLGDVSCRLENRHSRTTTVRRSASLCFVSRRHSPGRVTKPASVSALAFSRRHSPERESALVPVHAKWKPYNGLEQFEQL